MPTNAYQHSRTENEFATPEYAESDMRSYAVPNADSADAPYTDTFGWAPSLRLGPSVGSPVALPDATRLGTEPRREAVPDNGEAPEPFFRNLDADKARRYSVEYQDADGWEENKEYPGYPSATAGANRFGRNPRETPPPEPRPTSRMAPRTYLFTRPFMVGRQHLDGLHFSMADHRRNYDVLGMAPARTWRNTYRLDPQPWDTGVTDMPPANAPTIQDMQEVPVTVEVAYQSRNWRLS